MSGPVSRDAGEDESPALRYREAALLGAILLLGGALRIWRLDAVPPGLFCDEAAIANNARSLAMTGRDVSGRLFPLHPHEPSFEEWGIRGGIVYKPVLPYAMAPFVGLFGTTPTIARLPAALFGVAGLLAVYVAGRRWIGPRAAMAAAGLLAVWPWHLHFSRIGFEAVSFPTLLTFGMGLLLRGLERPRALLGGAALLGLCLYAYPSATVVVPLLAGAFAWIGRDAWKNAWRPAVGAAALLGLFFLPILLMVLGNVHQERAQSLLITAADVDGERGIRFLRDVGLDAVLGVRALKIAALFLYNYVSYLGPGFLFLDGDPNPRHGVSGFGTCLLLTLPLLILGLVALVRTRHERSSQLLLAWLILYPVAPSLTVEGPHAIRALHGVPALALLAGLGFDILLRFFNDSFSAGSGRGLRKAALGVAAALAVTAGAYDILRYLGHYHSAYPSYAEEAWQGGVGDAIVRLDRRPEKAARRWVSSRIFNAYAFIRFFARLDPRRLDPAQDVNGQLASQGYGVRFPSAAGLVRPGDLGLLLVEEADALDRAEVLEELPGTDGRPRFVLVRFGVAK